ncbi:MAG: CocE/NonD family hydrolase [Actinomycetota bacterium]|nr:CocE/NonD family hydrolase [Actinomycetota bacterium]
MRFFKRLTAVAAIAALAFAVMPGTPVRAADPPKGAKWSEHYFPMGDGLTTLHADVFRPADLSAKKKTPVILSVSPYFNHSGQEPERFNPRASGPSDRFYDFLDLSRILDRGYTYVMVDLPGFGGSGGCNDWGGIREQGAVKAAVEWAAKQPWSTGKVGMIGKSYDGWTGLMGMAQDPKGLAAVISMEPVYAGYRYLYNNGVRFLTSLTIAPVFTVADAKPGTMQDDPMYNLNGAPQAYCYPLNIGLQQDDDPNSAFWRERDLLRQAKGSDVPLFLTQGFLETNTKPDGAFDFFNSLKGPNRAWFGQFDHVRGWEKLGERFQTGRDDFVEEMMRFLDHYVKGVPLKKAPVHRDPNIAVQDALGRYRAEKSWPPPDSRLYWSKLRPGEYMDSANNSSAGQNAGNGIWTFSQPLRHEAWLSGEPAVKVKLTAAPRANLVANIYDVDPKGGAKLISRGANLIRGAGDQTVKFEMYGQDWPIKKGHRIGVILSSSNTDWWTHVPTRTPVTVNSAEVGLPFLKYNRTRFIQAKASTPRLEEWSRSEYTTVKKGTVSDNDRKFNLPGRLQRR